MQKEANNNLLLGANQSSCALQQPSSQFNWLNTVGPQDSIHHEIPRLNLVGFKGSCSCCSTVALEGLFLCMWCLSGMRVLVTRCTDPGVIHVFIVTLPTA